MVKPHVVSIFNDCDLFEYSSSIEDERFDLIYPADIRVLSPRHWTPVAVARKAAELLVTQSRTRVLDVGCGPGKFCMVGALTTAGHFTGVEHRERLARLAQDTIQRERIPNARIIRANITEVDFSAYDAFYLFNPFEENLFKMGKIDRTTKLSALLYHLYTRHVAAQLGRAPLGTCVVTYHGLCEEIPASYRCEDSWFDDALKLWRKIQDSPAANIPPPLCAGGN